MIQRCYCSLRRSLPIKRALITCILLGIGFGFSLFGQAEDKDPKVLALSPHIVEILYDLQLESQILAVAEGTNFPPEVVKHPTIKAHGQINIEQLVKWQPDLILAWPYGQASALPKRLKPFNIPVVFSDPKTFEALGEEYIKIARLFPKHPEALSKARIIRSQLQQSFQRLATQYASPLNVAPVRVFLPISDSPLRTLNQNHPIMEIIQLCGGQNVFAEAQSPAPLVSEESVIQRSPELIILSRSVVRDSQALQLWRERLKVPAVKDGHLVEIHPDFLHRPSVRTLKVADKICQAIARSRQTR